MTTAETAIRVTELDPQKFSLAVIYDGRTFDCGTYISRTAALLAGRLFVQRKQGEEVGQRKRPRRK